MGRIKINDLPEDQKINKDEMRKVLGGWTAYYTPYSNLYQYSTGPISTLPTPLPKPIGFRGSLPEPIP